MKKTDPKHNVEKKILVVGSANLDVLATTNDDQKMVRKRGRIDLSFGGAAHNIAVNLSMLGTPAKFLGSLNDSAVAKMILSDFAQHQIEVIIQANPELADPVFVGQFYDGDLVSSISSSPVEDVTFDEKTIKAALKNSCSVVINCVLSVPVLNQIIKVANEANLPIYASANTESRALKMPQLKGSIEMMFLNEAEMNYLVEHTDDLTDWQSAADQQGCKFLVTRGPKGIQVLTPHEPAADYPVEALEITGNTLGAGDFIVASVIHYLYSRQMPLPEAIQRAQQQVRKILQQDHVHMGKGNALRLGIQAMAQQAERDTLTNLLNRFGLHNYFQTQGIEQHQRMTCLLLDIDHFKKVNDTYGHDAGDKVLQEISHILREVIRGGDAAGRWGGEELILLLNNVGLEHAREVGERIREKLRVKSPTWLNNEGITTSIGVAEKTEQDSLESLIGRADKALYKAKDQGRDMIILA